MTVRRRRLVTPALGAALLAALVASGVPWPRAVESHAFLVKSAPGRRATLNQGPPRVELWFNERVEPAYSTVSVWDASGARVDARDVALDAGDPKRLAVSLGPLPPGTYTVRFRVLSVDGHLVESSFPFTVKSAATPPGR